MHIYIDFSVVAGNERVREGQRQDSQQQQQQTRRITLSCIFLYDNKK